MNSKRNVLIFIGLFLAAVFLTAETQALKERFIQRKPAIDALKNQEKVGENNVGKLVVRGQVNAKENEIVNAENTDRETVYQEIAGGLNITSLEVGKRRALQIANLASPGHWLQNPDGQWRRK
ncbi:MAG: YdbL family protein [Candidatus Aminicenantes bacterium]|nr:YdbL family protein [Candidatus Aminicenantes bacterium]